MKNLWKPPLQQIFSTNIFRIRLFFRLCDAVSPKFGKDRRCDMSVDCLSYLIKHMLTNEEAKFFFAVPVTLYISLGCVRTKVYVAKAHPTNEMARFRFQEKKL